MRTDYTIRLFDQNGIYISEINDFEQFELTRVKNDIGTLNIIIPELHYSPNDFQKDYRVEVYRNNQLVGDTCWLLQRKELSLTNNEQKISLTFADAVDILKRRINAWYSCDEPQCFGALEDHADDMMKMLMRFNFGDLVTPVSDPVFAPYVSPGTSPVDVQGIPPAVQIAYEDVYGSIDAGRPMDIQIDGYGGSAVVISQEISFVDILSALQDISNAAYAIPVPDLRHNVWFDIEYTPMPSGLFMFKTWTGVRGNDLRNKVLIGPEYGNLNDATYIEDYTNRADIAYVLSDGDNSLQTVGVAKLDPTQNNYYYALPFGPVEIATDFQQENPSAELLVGEGLTALGNLSKIKTLDGTIIHSKFFDFMEHYNFGDLVTLRWGDIVETLEISEFTISFNEAGVEEITVPLNIL